jgi:hypothetical protein
MVKPMTDLTLVRLPTSTLPPPALKRDEPAERCQGVHTALHRVAADAVEHHVHRVTPRGLAVGHHLVGAALADEVGLVRRADRRDDPGRAERAGQLHGEVTGAAGRRGDQDGLALLEVAGPKRTQRDQTAADQRQRRRRVRLDGYQADQSGVGDDEVGEGVLEHHTTDPVAHREPGHLRTEPHDGTHDLATRPERGPALTGRQQPDQSQARPNGLDTYQQLPRSGRGVRRLDNLGGLAGGKADPAQRSSFRR